MYTVMITYKCGSHFMKVGVARLADHAQCNHWLITPHIVPYKCELANTQLTTLFIGVTEGFSSVKQPNPSFIICKFTQ